MPEKERERETERMMYNAVFFPSFQAVKSSRNGSPTMFFIEVSVHQASWIEAAWLRWCTQLSGSPGNEALNVSKYHLDPFKYRWVSQIWSKTVEHCQSSASQLRPNLQQRPKPTLLAIGVWPRWLPLKIDCSSRQLRPFLRSHGTTLSLQRRCWKICQLEIDVDGI